MRCRRVRADRTVADGCHVRQGRSDDHAVEWTWFDATSGSPARGDMCSRVERIWIGPAVVAIVLFVACGGR